MTEAISSFGTLLQIGDGATPIEGFTTIAEVLDISGPALTLDTEDVTSHSSPGGYSEFVGTRLHAGAVTFEVNFVPGHSTHSAGAGLIKDQVDRRRRNFQLVIPTPTPTTWAFSAFVTGFEVSSPTAGKLAASVALTITGQPTLT